MKRIIFFSVVIAFTFSLLIVLLPRDLRAKTKWIKLQTKSGRTFSAIYGSPDGSVKYPAVIYNHGTKVRRLGYNRASEEGYDVKDFVEALVNEGYTAIAPIRDIGQMVIFEEEKISHSEVMRQTGEEWSEAIEFGIDAVNSAVRFLKGQPNVAGEKIGVIGFSEGGLVTLWTSFSNKDLKAIVLMSPANIGKSREYRFKRAVKGVDAITSPVFLTFGDSDIDVIYDNLTELFIPKMEEIGKDFEYKIYSGDHRWFHEVRKEYWNDIINFFNKYLKQ